MMLGRKGYLPKKLRMSGDCDSIQSSSPHYLSEPGSGHSTGGNPMSPTSHSDIVPNGTNHHNRRNSGAMDINGYAIHEPYFFDFLEFHT